MNMETIKTWLLSVGDDYHIHEAHYRQRRGLLPPARHWVYNDDIPATPYKGGPIRKTEQDGYDLIETITVKSNILISINAYAENGRSALYGLEASMAMDDVRVIFGQCVTMLGIQGDVTNLTLVDETEENPRWRYQANFCLSSGRHTRGHGRITISTNIVLPAKLLTTPVLKPMWS